VGRGKRKEQPPETVFQCTQPPWKKGENKKSSISIKKDTAKHGEKGNALSGGEKRNHFPLPPTSVKGPKGEKGEEHGSVTDLHVPMEGGEEKGGTDFPSGSSPSSSVEERKSFLSSSRRRGEKRDPLVSSTLSLR